jgi:hypothetical protein
MTKKEIMEALENEDLRKKLLNELEIEELEERVAPSRIDWICYRPAPV